VLRPIIIPIPPLVAQNQWHVAAFPDTLEKQSSLFLTGEKMASRMWGPDADADDELADVDVDLAIGNYGQGSLYDDGAWQAALTKILN
jgi:hypothetical protein